MPENVTRVMAGVKCPEGHFAPRVRVDWGSHIQYLAPQRCTECGQRTARVTVPARA